MTEQDFEIQKMIAVKQWIFIKKYIHTDPYRPIHSWKVEAVTTLKIRFGWKYNCFLCNLFNTNRNACNGCPLVSCFYDEESEEKDNETPYEHLEWCQDHGEPLEKIIEDIDKIISVIQNLKYKEVPNGTLNDSHLTR